MHLLQQFRCQQPSLSRRQPPHALRICCRTVKGREGVLVRDSGRYASIKGRDFVLHEVVRGMIQNIASYGAFVDMDGTTGLLHISQISHERLTSVDQVFKVGDEIKAMVWSLDEVQQRISLSTKHLEPKRGDMLRYPQRVYEEAEATAAAYRERIGETPERPRKTKQPRNSADSDEALQAFWQRLSPYDVVAGEVQEVKPYGLFVDVGSGTRALLHISQITGVRITSETVQKLFQVGDKVKAMILPRHKDKLWITLSTKKLENEACEMLENRQRVFDEAEARAAAYRESLSSDAEDS